MIQVIKYSSIDWIKKSDDSQKINESVVFAINHKIDEKNDEKIKLFFK